MKITLVVAAFAACLAATTGLWPGVRPGVQAQERPGRQRLEYQVVASQVDHFPQRKSVQVEGKAKVTSTGPKESAEAMTRQFNALAAEGWEHVGPVITAETHPEGPRSSVVHSLFRRAKP